MARNRTTDFTPSPVDHFAGTYAGLRLRTVRPVAIQSLGASTQPALPTISLVVYFICGPASTRNGRIVFSRWSSGRPSSEESEPRRKTRFAKDVPSALVALPRLHPFARTLPILLPLPPMRYEARCVELMHLLPAVPAGVCDAEASAVPEVRTRSVRCASVITLVHPRTAMCSNSP